MDNIEIQLIHKPRRKALIKRGIHARHYFEYCEEIGCDIWEDLVAMADPGSEPVCLWLPDPLIAPGTSVYVQGVEKPEAFAGPIPEGFDLIDLPASDYLQFRGRPFAEETFEQAIEEVWEAMAHYDPATLGYEWNEDSPRIQLEPRCERGYIELKAVRKK